MAITTDLAARRRPRFPMASWAILFAALCMGSAALASHRAQESLPAGCGADLRLPGKMSDIVSNALTRGLGREEVLVREYLNGVRGQFSTGDELLKAAASHFEVTEQRLREQVERFHHTNCTHPGGERAVAVDSLAKPITDFALDVTLHVVIHELGHALVREFDLPILGNEETLADAFATHFLTTHLPERAPAALLARVESLMFEAREVPRNEWSVTGEHNNDARRAHQIAALAVAADRVKYRAVAEAAGMSDRDIRRACDYGTEIHRSWRRILAPLWMPAGMTSTEVSFDVSEGSSFVEALETSGLGTVLRDTLQRFDWHSQVTLKFKDGDGGASWSRSKRTITVCRAYLNRFSRQGQSIRAGDVEATLR